MAVKGIFSFEERSREMLKPQAIRDQEFQIKFRGYDPIEVKSYLELLADDFFELSEENRSLQERLRSCSEKSEDQVKAPGALEALEGVEDLDLEEEREEQHETLRELRAKLAHAESRIDNLSTENMGYLSQVGDLSKQLEIFESEAAAEGKEREELMKQVTALTRQNAELKEKNSEAAREDAERKRLAAELDRLQAENALLKEEEGSLKKTLVSAQSFADTLRADAEKDAASMIEEAKVEVAACTAQLEETVARLSAEIEALEGQKVEVREELRGVLERYMSALDRAAVSFSG